VSTKNYLIKNAIIIGDSDQSVKDILISEGIIKMIRPAIPVDANYEIIDAKGSFVSTGWFDMRCRLSDPGFEDREDLESGAMAAAAGGFTEIACLPDTLPIVASKSQVEYIHHQSANLLTRIYPLGAASLNLEGKELSEMYDMHRAGALGFSNADVPFADAGYLLRALMYVKSFGGLIFSHAEDTSLSTTGMVNESITTIATGLKTAPRMAESTAIQTQIEVAAYAKCHLHFSHVSTRESVELIRMAKKRGISITADVALMHLVFTDNVLETFDSNFKIKPPLRSTLDRDALIEAINDDTIDAIITDHSPLNKELKNLEFDYAAYGVTGFQTFYPMFNQELLGKIELEKFIEKITIGPRKIMGLPNPVIKENEIANLVVFNPNTEWHLNDNSNYSKSVNSPYYNKKLKGKILFTANQFKSYKSTF
jgi:dihydroorotase